jgi:hypothetical protein
MFRKFLAIPIAARKRYGVPCRRTLMPAVVATLALLAGACSSPRSPWSAGPDPSDLSVRVPVTAYRSTVRGYTRQRPVEPGSWQEQNERVTPAPKQ